MHINEPHTLVCRSKLVTKYVKDKRSDVSYYKNEVVL